jgi:hypothetical protein
VTEFTILINIGPRLIQPARFYQTTERPTPRYSPPGKDGTEQLIKINPISFPAAVIGYFLKTI